MSQELNAEIISIGTEILLGELTDTNSVFIARAFRDVGINVFFMTSVGDNRKRIADAIQSALSRADIVITCGGLGPTVDDMTRQSVADATERGLTFHQALLDQIAERFASYKVTMTQNNRQQAYLPDEAIVIENPVGTAPSFIVEYGEKVVISLPGVPREMKFLMQERVVPYLRQRYQLGIIKAKLLKVAGVGESSLDDMIGREILEHNNPTVGLAAHHGEIDIRITAKAANETDADQMILETETKIRERVGKYIYGVDGDTLQSVLVSLMQENDYQLAIVQAGMDDVVTQMVTSTEAGQAVIALSEILEHPDDARVAYEIAEGMTLREMAASIAQTVCRTTHADASIVVLSLPDVDEDADVSEASVVHVYTPEISRDRVYGFGGKSDFARAWVTRWSLSNVWRMLKDRADAE